MRGKRKKLTFFINSSCVAGNVTRSLRRAESLLVHQLPADRWMLWDCILQAMWHTDVERSEITSSQNGVSTTQQILIFLFAIQNSWNIPQNVGYFQEFLLYNSVQSTPQDCTATCSHLSLKPWWTYIYLCSPQKGMKAKRTPTRNRYLFHLYTCHLHWEQSVLLCCDSS